MRDLKEENVQLPSDLASGHTSKFYHRHTSMLSAALVSVQDTRAAYYPSTDLWRMKIHTAKCYSAVQKNEITNLLENGWN